MKTNKKEKITKLNANLSEEEHQIMRDLKDNYNINISQLLKNFLRAYHSEIIKSKRLNVNINI
jgi:hypothetical protein